jgi:uncharacterized integral membrane protein
MRPLKPVWMRKIDVSARDALDGAEAEFSYGDIAVDWQKAAPSWADIFIAIILPIASLFVIAGGFCLTVSWLVVPPLSTKILVIFAAAVLGALTLLTYLVNRRRLRSNVQSTI